MITNQIVRVMTRFWSNLATHAVKLSADTPVILYAEVNLGHAPVIDASVVVELTAINQVVYWSIHLSNYLFMFFCPTNFYLSISSYLSLYINT